MDAVDIQSSNLLRIVHAAQSNCISEYLDSGTSLQVRKISTSMQSNRCNAPESIYKHIDKCALCNGILGPTLSICGKKLGSATNHISAHTPSAYNNTIHSADILKKTCSLISKRFRLLVVSTVLVKLLMTTI